MPKYLNFKYEDQVGFPSKGTRIQRSLSPMGARAHHTSTRVQRGIFEIRLMEKLAFASKREAKPRAYNIQLACAPALESCPAKRHAVSTFVTLTSVLDAIQVKTRRL
jgi:hypothetical protein